MESFEERRASSRQHKNNDNKDKFFVIRNILNSIFIIGAIVGMLVYFFSNQTVGTIIILAAMALKLVECCLRMMR